MREDNSARLRWEGNGRDCVQLKEEVLKWIVHTKHLTKEEGLKMNMCTGDRSISRAEYINIDILLCFILDLTGTYQFVVMQ